MSIIKFLLREEHLKLLKYIKTNLKGTDIILSVEDIEDEIPITDLDKYNYINLVLNGKPEPNLFRVDYSNEQKAEWDKLYKELPMALSVILETQKFDLGLYKTKYHDRNWKKIN